MNAGLECRSGYGNMCCNIMLLGQMYVVETGRLRLARCEAEIKFWIDNFVRRFPAAVTFSNKWKETTEHPIIKETNGCPYLSVEAP
jgi:hypothetical protein